MSPTNENAKRGMFEIKEKALKPKKVLYQIGFFLEPQYCVHVIYKQ